MSNEEEESVVGQAMLDEETQKQIELFKEWREKMFQKWLEDYMPSHLKWRYKKILHSRDGEKAIAFIRRCGFTTVTFQRDPWMVGISWKGRHLATARYPGATTPPSEWYKPPEEERK